MTTKTKNDELVKQEPAALATVPEFLKGHGRLGGEQVEQRDLALPRIAIAQSNSPAYKKQSATRIEGLEEGEFFNTVTRQIYGQSIIAVPILFSKSYIKFRPMEQGGGVIKMQSNAEGIAPADLEFGPEGEKPVWTEFRNFLCFLPETQQIAAVSMKSTDTKAAKQWNSQMRLGDNIPYFSKRYTLTSIPKRSKQDLDYYGHDFPVPLGYVDEATFAVCKGIFADFQGKEIKVDTSDLDVENETEGKDIPF